MKISGKWLMALPVLVLCAPLSLFAEQESKNLSATIETGAAGLAVSDDISRVNEYSSIRTKPGVNPYGKVDLSVKGAGITLDGDVRFMDSRDQTHNVKLDVKRVLRSSFSYDVFQHWLDHDQINYLDAAIPKAPALSGPSTTIGTNTAFLESNNTITPNFVPGFLVTETASGTRYVANSWTPTAGYTAQQIGRASVFGEDLTPNADFSVVRREWKSHSDLTLPQLPNLTFHFTYRNEDRNGMEQSIGMSKCTSCHVTGKGKKIDENTRDITAGVTGKFGLLTLNYSYMNRQFREHGADPTMTYDPALSPGMNFPANYLTAAQGFDNRLLYDYRNGGLRYDVTPDSNKDSHVIKAKLDLPHNTTMVASYVNTTVDSTKTGDADIFSLDQGKLKTSYDAYGGRITATPWKNLTVTLRGKAEKIENDDVTLSFNTLPVVDVASWGTAPNQFTPTAESLSPTRHSVLSRDVATLGMDTVYRLAKRTTLRLGYEYKNEDRDDELFGKTETHKIKASLNSRPTNTLSMRASYTYKDIENPFQNPDAALVPTTSVMAPFTTTVIGGPTYGVSFYDERIADLSNQPDSVHEGAVTATWSPSARFSTTAYYRVKMEQNDLNTSSWKQQTHSPGISFWYAPSDKVNITLAYNFMKQTSKTDFCQGWYDG
ncbi:MtrB/PioB family outer membrane beta-barrel protein [Geobacter benzoatilyticus]|uniref:MtrB/PioB family outer membrane beta-barrel protein n=2 Tax=Geobacter benzoatilyticus TaxID=2815309 RepID=A0ABX7Q3Q0_9BACT|nr:MtrB/PioB family outer membrane beta-barrel protein [Geobacter benzoatilyticus]